MTKEMRLWWGGLTLLLVVCFLLRIIGLDSDPPRDVSKDLSLTIDGSWYVGAALDWASGRESSDPGAYDPWLFGSVQRAMFWLLGPSHWVASLTAVLFALVAIGLTAAAARRAHGIHAGLLAGLLLGLFYPFFVLSRAPGIYVPASAIAAGVLYLRARQAEKRNWSLEIAAWTLLVVGIVGMKSILVLQAVALLFASVSLRDGWRQLRTRPLTAAGVLVFALVAALLAWKSGWLFQQTHKLGEYLKMGGGPGAVPGLVLTLEHRLGLLTLAPLIVTLALVAGLYLKKTCFDQLCAWVVLIHIFLLSALGYSPLRYLLPAFPALAILAARTLSVLIASGSFPEKGLSRAPASRLFRVGVIAFFVQCVTLSVFEFSMPWVIHLLFAFAVVVGLFIERFVVDREFSALGRLGPRLASAALVLFLGLHLFRGGQALAFGETSIDHAGREIDALIEPGAHVTGPFAHVLTYESHQLRTYTPILKFGEGDLSRTLRKRGFTHFAMDISENTPTVLRAFENDGATLSLVHEFFIRGQRVHLYRFPWAEELVTRTAFEEGIGALQSGELDAAESWLRRAHEEHPGSAVVMSALGAVLFETERFEEARKLLETAVSTNPSEVSAMRTLVRIYLDRHDWSRARDLLERVTWLDPSDGEAEKLREQLPDF